MESPHLDTRKDRFTGIGLLYFVQKICRQEKEFRLNAPALVILYNNFS